MIDTKKSMNECSSSATEMIVTAALYICLIKSKRKRLQSFWPFFIDRALTVGQARGADIYRSGCVNGVMVGDIVLDTGASRTLVHEDLVPPCTLREGEVTIRCAHGDNITYPLASIKVSIGREELSVRAAVSKTLPASVLLRRDVPEHLVALVPGCTGNNHKSTDEKATPGGFPNTSMRAGLRRRPFEHRRPRHERGGGDTAGYVV